VRPPILQLEGFTFHPISEQAAQYLAGLDERDWNRFVVAATILVASLCSGRPPAGRSELVRGTVRGLHELRLTMPGTPGPQKRILYIREARRILCVRGITKRQSALPRREVDAAARVVTGHRRQHADEDDWGGKAPQRRGRRRAA
jgi:hypothetical protein